ncbi:rhamnosyltransferase [compost metagenome]
MADQKVATLITTNSKVVGVLIAYNTPPETLLRTARRIGRQVFRLVIVDNSDRPTDIAGAVAEAHLPGIDYVPAGGNIGIAAAQNLGIRRALEMNANYILFLDDDSSFPDEGVVMLLNELEKERRMFPQTAAIGPRIIDEPTGQELTYVWDGAKMRRRKVHLLTEVAFLVSSGALIDVRAFLDYGFFREEYFIDHVDKEWGLRVALRGVRQVVTPEVTMIHQLGDTPTTSLRGSVRFKHESPARDYYLTRNAILVMRDLSMPLIRYPDMLRLLIESSIRKTIGPSRTWAQRKAVVLGLWHGLSNRGGPQQMAQRRT